MIDLFNISLHVIFNANIQRGSNLVYAAGPVLVRSAPNISPSSRATPSGRQPASAPGQPAKHQSNRCSNPEAINIYYYVIQVKSRGI